MTVSFNNKGVLVNNSEGETVIRGNLDLGNNLFMVSADNTHAPTIPMRHPERLDISSNYHNIEHPSHIASSASQNSSSIYILHLPRDRDVDCSHSKGMVHYVARSHSRPGKQIPRSE